MTKLDYQTIKDNPNMENILTRVLPWEITVTTKEDSGLCIMVNTNKENGKLIQKTIV